MFPQDLYSFFNAATGWNGGTAWDREQHPNDAESLGSLMAELANGKEAEMMKQENSATNPFSLESREPTDTGKESEEEKKGTKEGVAAEEREQPEPKHKKKTVGVNSRRNQEPVFVEEGIEQVLVEEPQPSILSMKEAPQPPEEIEQEMPEELAVRCDELVPVASESEVSPVKSKPTSLFKSFKKRTRKLSRTGFFFRKRTGKKSVGKTEAEEQMQGGEKTAAKSEVMTKNDECQVPIVMTPSVESEAPSMSEVSMSVRLIPTQVEMHSSQAETTYVESQTLSPTMTSDDYSYYSESTAPTSTFTDTTAGVRTILQSIEEATFVLIDGTATAVVKDVSSRVATAKAVSGNVSGMMTRASSAAKTQMGEAVQGFVRDAEGLVREPSSLWSTQASKHETPMTSDNQGKLADENVQPVSASKNNENVIPDEMAGTQAGACSTARNVKPGSSGASTSSSHFTETTETSDSRPKLAVQATSSFKDAASDSRPTLVTLAASSSRDETGILSPERSVEVFDKASSWGSAAPSPTNAEGIAGNPSKSSGTAGKDEASFKDITPTPAAQSENKSFETAETITSSQAFQLLKEVYYEHDNGDSTSISEAKETLLMHPPGGVQGQTSLTASIDDSTTKSIHIFESKASTMSTHGEKSVASEMKCIGSKKSTASRKSSHSVGNDGSEVKGIGTETSKTFSMSTHDARSVESEMKCIGSKASKGSRVSNYSARSVEGELKCIGSEASKGSRVSNHSAKSVEGELKCIGSKASKGSRVSNHSARSVEGELKHTGSETSKASKISNRTTPSTRSNPTPNQKKPSIGRHIKRVGSKLLSLGSKNDASTKSSHSGRREEVEDASRDDVSSTKSIIRGISATKLDVSESPNEEVDDQESHVRSCDSEWEKCLAWARREKGTGGQVKAKQEPTKHCEHVQSAKEQDSTTESLSSDGPMEMAFSLKAIEDVEGDLHEVRNEGNVRVFYEV